MTITLHNWRVSKQPDQSISREKESDSGHGTKTPPVADPARPRITLTNWRRTGTKPAREQPTALGHPDSIERNNDAPVSDAASNNTSDLVKVVTLGLNANTDQPVTLTQDARREGLYIIGKNGTGKSTLIENLIVQDMEADYGLCLLDPHGDLLDHVLRRVPQKREADVIFLIFWMKSTPLV